MKKSSVKICGRISANTMSKEELAFVKEQLELLSPTQLIRKSIRVYYKHETGQLYSNDISSIRKSLEKSADNIENSEKFKAQINNVIDNSFLEKRGG